VERGALHSGNLDEQLRFAQLYLDAVATHPDDPRRAEPALLRAAGDDALADSMVIARAHGALFRPVPQRFLRAVVDYLRDDFPDALWRERRLVWLALVLFLLGGVLGAAIVEADRDALSVVLPEIHQAQDPLERVRADLRRQEFDAFRALEFASFLFTHNIEVGFLFFSLGLSFGFGTALALIWNGVPIGALAAQYHGSGLGTFFWAWILPHGLLELSALAIAGGAGFVLARGMLRPGRDRVGVALAREARTAIPLVVGTIPMLIVAGLIEGTLSQMHGSIAPAPAKLAVAALSIVSFAVLVARRRSLGRTAMEG
jgi:uncharacterized membrane protein SpoIIM required for sporulation